MADIADGARGGNFLQVDERSFRDVHTLSNANAGQKYEPKVA